jgi:hypothetical protein
MSDEAQPPNGPTSTVTSLLAGTEALAGDAALAEIASRVFDFTQFLLDDDENLTKVGNLNGEARDRLRARCLELLGVAPAEGSAVDDDAGTP